MVVGNNESTAAKNAGKSMAISIAMAMQRFDAGRIAQWSTSVASLESTGCHHRSRVCAVLPQWPPWSTNLIETHKTLPKRIQVFTQNHWMPPSGDCPWRPPWLTNLLKQHKTPTKHNFLLATTVHVDLYLFMRISCHQMDPLLSSLMSQAA